MTTSVQSASLTTRISAFATAAKGLPSKDLAPLLKAHGLEHVAPRKLSAAAKAVGMPRAARVAMLGSQQQSLASLGSATKAISKTALVAGKAAETKQLARAGGFFSRTFPRLSGVAGRSVGALGTATGAAGTAVKAAGAGKGALGFLARIGMKVAGPLAKVGGFVRMIPGLNLIFVAVDGFKLLKNPSAANLAKFGLSVGAALPIPGASLLGGVRAGVGVVEMFKGKKSPQPA